LCAPNHKTCNPLSYLSNPVVAILRRAGSIQPCQTGLAYSTQPPQTTLAAISVTAVQALSHSSSIPKTLLHFHCRPPGRSACVSVATARQGTSTRSQEQVHRASFRQRWIGDSAIVASLQQVARAVYAYHQLQLRHFYSLQALLRHRRDTECWY
jgi:hypothetical protein